MITAAQKNLTRKFLLYKTLSNMWFLSAVWLYFYRIYITDQQVGVLDALAFTVGLIAEVPSGALADKYGRDRIVKLGQILAGCGLLIQALGNGFIPFFVGQSVMMIGVAFTSGADEALFFNKIKFKRESSQWRRLVTRGSQVALAATLVTATIGGYLHMINPRIPWIATGVSFIASALIIWGVKETKTKRDQSSLLVETKEYLMDIKSGFAEFVKPNLRIYIPIIVTVQGLFYTAGYGILRLILLDRFGFSPFQGAVAITSYGIITIIILSFVHKSADKLSEKKVIALVSISAAAALLLSVASIGMWGYVVVLSLYVGEYVLQPFMSETINYHVTNTQRATVLSVASFLKTLPYVLLAPLIGVLNVSNKLDYFLIGWPLLIFGSIIGYIVKQKGDYQIKIND